MNTTTPKDGETDPFKLAEQKRWLDLARLGRIAWNTWAEAELDKPEYERTEVDLSNLMIDVWDFANLIFPSRLKVHRSMFSYDTYFDCSVFFSGVSFKKSVFSRSGSFSRVHFFGKVYFEGMKFQGSSAFLYSTFRSTSSFDNSIFVSLADFRNSSFVDSTHFTSARFLNDAFLFNIFFFKNIGFSNVDFRGEAIFTDTQFGETVNFNESRFYHAAYFSRSVFSSNVNFDDVQIDSALQMSEVIFLDSMTAKNTHVDGPAYFTRVTFEVPPDFISTAFKQLPSLLGASFEYPCSNTVWGKCGIHDGEARFRRLKQLAADTHDHELELSLFASEVRAKRFHSLKPNRMRDLPRLCMNYIYEWVSDFGQSWIRPLGWLTLTIGLAFVTFWSTAPAATSLWISAVAAGVNVFPFAGQAVLGREIMTKGLCPMPETDAGYLDCLTTLYTISAVEGVFGLIFLFLIGLGLRNRFRIK